MNLDPAKEHTYRERVSDVLDGLRAAIRDLRGADQDLIDQVCARTGLERLPVAVDEYMRTVGADYHVCNQMFPGVGALSIRAVLRPELDWVLQKGRIPYAVSDTMLWLGPSDPPDQTDAYDPVVWKSGDRSEPSRAGGRFLADLERRVQDGIRSLNQLRQYVEGSGFDTMDADDIEAHAAAKTAGLRRSMERALVTEIDETLLARMHAMTVESINRDVALYRRLKV